MEVIMALIDSIETIINSIPKDCCFDSHFIIQSLIEKYSDEYLLFCSTYVNVSDSTNTAHRQIGREIKKLCDNNLIVQLEYKGWSFNFHHNISLCTIYRKL
jgi:hypothetical protein